MELAATQRIATAGNKEFAEAGSLIGYGVSDSAAYRRGAYFVDRILRGAKPGELPIEQAAKFDLIVNKKTGSALGIKIPDSITLRADKVIE